MATIAHDPAHDASRFPVARIRRAAPADAALAARALARAFHDDPVFRWITPDDARRAAQLPRVFELLAVGVLRHEASEVAVDGSAAALWVPPGRTAVAEDGAEALFAGLAEVAGEDAERLFEAATLVEDRRPAGAFHFLEFLGVAPERQGHGLGSSLLAAGLERCDREGAAAYLDATSMRNRALYERHGFQVIGRIAPRGGPALWQMWRDPQG